MSGIWLQLRDHREAAIFLVVTSACAGGIAGWFLARFDAVRRTHSLERELAQLRELRERRLDAFTRLTPPDDVRGQPPSPQQPKAEVR